MKQSLELVRARTWQKRKPAPRLVVSEWTDRNRVIGRGYPSPFPGPWRTARTPYLREPMDAFIDPAVETLVLLFSSQVGKSEMLLNTMLYAYGVDPAPGMMVLPILDLAASVSTDRLTPALKTCSALSVGSQKSRNTEDAILHKRINGAPLTMAGANSPASLSSRPVRYLWCDEIDRWPATTTEGDPLSLAKQRTVAFRRRKVVLTSTPTTTGASRIEDFYERSDKRVYEMPCPRCGEFFEVKWSHVRFERENTADAHLVHELFDEKGNVVGGCRGRIEDRERQDMAERGRWVPTAHSAERIRGYKVWAIVSPWVRLKEMVDSFLVVKEKVDTLRAWINLTLGESWEEQTQKIESSELLPLREEYIEEVPAGVQFLTAGVDTQDDRLESLVVGWGDGEESWIISRDTVMGDPQDPATWKALDEDVLLRSWPVEGGGVTHVQAALIDCLGHRTQYVYQAVRARAARRVFASIGKSGGQAGQLVTSPSALETMQGNVMRVIVDADQVKSLLYARLKLESRQGPEVIHFPMTVGDSFFKELTAEHLITERNKLGIPSKKWAKRPGRDRNEALDCYGLALAGMRIVAPTRARFQDLAARVQAAVLASRGARPEGPPRGAGPKRQRTQGWNGNI